MTQSHPQPQGMPPVTDYLKLTPDEYKELILLANVGYETTKNSPFDCFVNSLTDERLNQIFATAHYCDKMTIKVE